MTKLMKILVMGAGTVGSVYGAMMAEAGHDVILVTRPENAEYIRENDLILVNLATGEKKSIKIQAYAKVPISDFFDCILLTVRNEQLLQAAKDLKQCIQKDTFVVLFQNSLDGAEILGEIIGQEKVVMGFGAVGGSKKPGHVSYYIAKDEKTVIGELNGEKTKRIAGLKSVFESAGFPTIISSNIKSYVYTHTAIVLPMALIQICREDQSIIFGDLPDDLELAIKGMKETLQILKKSRLKLATEGQLLLRLPNFVIKWLLEKKIVKGIPKEIRKHIWQHALLGANEWIKFRQQFLEMAEKSEFRTPVLFHLVPVQKI